MNITACGCSDIGRKQINQDSLFYEAAPQGPGVCAVSDGIGGLERGEAASAMATAAVGRWWRAQQRFLSPQQAVDQLSRLMFEINQSIQAFARQEDIRCGATLTLLYLGQDSYTIAHAGDSRAYLFEGQCLQQLTGDHSREIDGRSYLTNGVGCQSKLLCDCFSGPLRPGQRFLLCSDGIYKRSPHSALAQMLAAHTGGLPQLCRQLTDSAKRSGESDNITVIAVGIS